METKFLERPAAAQYLLEQRGLRVSPKTLQKYATTGGGPTYQRFGNRAVYTPENLDVWANQKLSAPQGSTSGDGSGDREAA